MCKLGERGERARHAPCQRVEVEAAAHPKADSAAQRSYAAPTATMCPYGTRAPYPIGWGAP